jgi:hypothetical protein
MSNIVIKRCPVCESIGSRAQEVAAALKNDLGLDTHTKDGTNGEFSVLAGGVPVIQRTGEWLPSVDEVEAAVWNATPTRMGL